MDVVNVAWTLESEASQLSSAHIGIAPMSDNPWTRGKCALKVIQYMAAGLPVISSNAGANREVVVQGETGLLADSADDWLRAIELLSGNESERNRLGSGGRQRMLQHYSSQTVLDSITENLRSRALIPA